MQYEFIDYVRILIMSKRRYQYDFLDVSFDIA